MTPIKFPAATLVLGEGQDQYQELPVHVEPMMPFTATSCWELSDAEMELIKSTRCIWISQLTFGRPFHPILPSVDQPEMNT